MIGTVINKINAIYLELMIMIAVKMERISFFLCWIL